MQSLLDIMASLRDPERGCAWDLEQDFSTIAPYTIEEAYEVADAIARDDMSDLRDELGDLLFQVAFHARMAEERGTFRFHDVVAAICDKMRRRHPHVFSDTPAMDASEVQANWEAIKAAEKRQAGQRASSALDGIATGMASLRRAEKLQRRAAAVGFDWRERAAVLAKVREEVDEIERALPGTGTPPTLSERAALEHELGDVLFAVVNLARHLALDAETALSAANRRFTARFQHMEQACQANADATLAALDETALDRLWEAAKQAERRGELTSDR